MKITKPFLLVADRLCHERAELSEFEQIKLLIGHLIGWKPAARWEETILIYRSVHQLREQTNDFQVVSMYISGQHEEPGSVFWLSENRVFEMQNCIKFANNLIVSALVRHCFIYFVDFRACSNTFLHLEATSRIFTTWSVTHTIHPRFIRIPLNIYEEIHSGPARNVLKPKFRRTISSVGI